MSRLFFLALAILLAACRVEGRTASPPVGDARWAADTELSWGEMQRVLVGHWRATTPENRTIETSYRVVSKGSALVETFTSTSGKETVTVYHRDGRALMLTHYCAQGNQARLKATEATREKVVFMFLDATNVGGDQGVMQKLVFNFRPDGFDQETVYREPSGQRETTTLHFFRE